MTLHETRCQIMKPKIEYSYHIWTYLEIGFFHCGIGIWRDRAEIDEDNKQVINAESTPSDDMQGLVNVICLSLRIAGRLFISRNY